MNDLKPQRGMSLVEVLVALVISLFLLGGIVQVYLANKASFSFSNSISRIQENGRFALDKISVDLRMAGFFGCASYDPDNTDALVNNLDPAGTDYNAALHDFIGAGLIEGTEGDGLNGSDSITIRGAKAGQVNIVEPYNTKTSDAIFVNTNKFIEKDDILMVSNCRGADIFQVSGTDPDTNAIAHNLGDTDPGNYNPDACAAGHCLSQTYGSDAAMFELQTVTYYIKEGENNTEPALWRTENGEDLELIEGVEQMQILYGVDTDNDDFANQYVVSTGIAAIGDMNDVMAVRISLLVRSEADFVTEDKQIYTFNGADDIEAPDNRLRQVFSTTIALRNRIGAS